MRLPAPAWLAAMTLVACSSSDAGVDLELGWTLEPSPNSPLAAIARIELDQASTVVIELWSDEVGPLRTQPGDLTTSHVINVLGMRAETEYSLQPVLIAEDGGERRGETLTFTTGGLPGGTPTAISTQGSGEAAITIVGPAMPMTSNDSPYLIGVDREGFVVWVYDPQDLRGSRGADRAALLLDDGNLRVLVPGGLRVITPGGVLVTEYSTDLQVHHDGQVLDDGNAVVLSRETRDLYVDQFSDTVTVTGDVVAKIDAGGAVLWSWSSFDHLDPQRYPTAISQRLDPMTNTVDWTHANSLTYDAARDAYIVSLRHQNWVLAIDATNGELLWILGADGDFALTAGTWFTSQHAARIGSDGVLMFDNGNDRDGNSRAVRFAIDEDALTATEVWSWDVGFEASNLGDADELDNGNVLVCAGGQRPDGRDARIAEVDPAGEVVWELDVGDGLWVYRAEQVRWLSAP